MNGACSSKHRCVCFHVIITIFLLETDVHLRSTKYYATDMLCSNIHWCLKSLLNCLLYFPLMQFLTCIKHQPKLSTLELGGYNREGFYLESKTLTILVVKYKIRIQGVDCPHLASVLIDTHAWPKSVGKVILSCCKWLVERQDDNNDHYYHPLCLTCKKTIEDN
jgi:hypothetical protein